MEPRPQKPRQPQGGRPGQQGHGGGIPPQNPQQGPIPLPDHDPQGYPQGYDPGAFVAPPRTDYDYSPLDLAPPGQRRRRQVIAGVIGALAVVLIGALIVFGWMLLRDDDPTDNGTNIAAVATESPVANTGGAESTPPVETVPTEDAAAQPTQPVSPTPTPPAQAPAVDTTEAGLTALLPDPALAPAGFDAGTDSTNDFAAVVAAIGGNRQAEQNLTDWGWTANVSRAFNNTAPTDGSTDALLASLHGFKDAPSAAAALTFYADYLASAGASDVEAPALGESARMLSTTDEAGNVSVSLYVQQGPVLYRFWGVASAGGDPTQAVIDLATQTLAP